MRKLGLVQIRSITKMDINLKPLKHKNFSGFNITYQKKQALYHWSQKHWDRDPTLKNTF